MPSVEETMERFAKMILEGMQRVHPPVSASDTQNAPRPESGERPGPGRRAVLNTPAEGRRNAAKIELAQRHEQ